MKKTGEFFFAAVFSPLFKGPGPQYNKRSSFISFILSKGGPAYVAASYDRPRHH